MLRRWREARENSRRERAAIAEAAKAEGIAEGRAEGIAEGKTEGRAEGKAEGRAEAQQQWREWYQRQTEAQEKGHSFTEPPPNLNGDTSEE